MSKFADGQAHWTDVLFLSQEEFGRLEVAGAVHLDEQARTELEEVILDFLAFREIWKQAPRRSAVRKVIARLQKSTDELCSSLDHLKAQSLASRDTIASNVPHPGAAEAGAWSALSVRMSMRQNDLTHFIELVQGARDAMREAVADVSDAGGDAGRPDVDGLLYSCHTIFARATGNANKVTYSAYTADYQSAFLEFAKTLLAQVGEQDLVSGGLGKRILRALQDKT